LAGLLGEAAHPRLRYSEHLEIDGEAMFEHACQMRLEGVVSKRKDGRYISGRSESWLKTKCVKRDNFPIIAFVEKLGAKPRKIASLYVGRREGDKLLYAGKARSGYTEEIARDIRERLDPLIIKSSPLSVPVKKPKATWVKPVVDAEIAYSSKTADGLLREAVFRGIREDLTPLREPAAAKTARPLGRARKKPTSRGYVPQENILQLLPKAVAPPKEELARYWRRVGEEALRYLGRRPLKLVRQVHGTIFYHKGKLPRVPPAVHAFTIEKREGGEGTRLWVDSIDGFLGLLEIGVIELHPWNATVDNIEHADQLAFDLDPGPGIEWNFVMETALALKALLKEEGLASWPKVTGRKGLHVMASLPQRPSHDEAHRYALRLAERLRKADPKRFTLSAALPEREGKLFIDYLRNGRGTTAVGAYSPRARRRFPIAAPVTWSDVENGIRPDAFSINGHPQGEHSSRRSDKRWNLG